MAKRPAKPAPRLIAVSLQDHIEIALSWHKWPHRIGVNSLHMLSPNIPPVGIRLTWAIWRLKRRGIIRTEWAHSYKQMMIGVIE